jgi:hypothetical protein
VVPSLTVTSLPSSSKVTVFCGVESSIANLS